MISTLDFIDFWHYSAWCLYSIELKRVNDLLIIINLKENEIVAWQEK